MKMYDKVHSAPGSVLRVEMTMNNEKAFRVYRASEADPDGEKDWWRRLRLSRSAPSRRSVAKGQCTLSGRAGQCG